MVYAGLSQLAQRHVINHLLGYLVVHVSVLLEHATASVGDWCPTVQNSVVVSPSRVEYPVSIS